MEPRFFGLTNSSKEFYLDQIFALMYYMGFSYIEAYNIPIWIRQWMLKRLNKELKASQKNNGSRAAHQNDADSRALMGRHRAQVPSKLRRFT